MKGKIKTILLIALIFVLVTSNVDALGIGIAPSRFTIDDALKGGAFDQKLTIYNADNESCNYEFVGAGEIGEWASFYALDGKTPINMTEVPGRSSKKIITRFSIPAYVANGSYTGKIYVQTIPENVTGEGQGATVHAVLRMAAEGTILVTGKQNLTGIVTNITAMDTEVNNTLQINVEFQNTGDVFAYPAIDVNITKNNSLVDHFVYNQTAVMPGANETIPVEWNTTGQIPGNYSLNVTASLNGDVLATKDLTVRILSPGTLTPEVPKGEPSTEM